MKSKLLIASLTAVLMSFGIGSIAHAQTAQPHSDQTPAAATVPVTPPALPDARAKVPAPQLIDAALRDTDPKLNGFVGDVPAKPSSK